LPYADPKAKLAYDQAQRVGPGSVARRERRALAARAKTARIRAERLAADPTYYDGKKYQPTLVERADRRDELLALIKSMEKPMTVRQIYYRATVAGIVPKTPAGTQRVDRLVTEFREEDLIPWNDITGNTRRTILYTMHKNAAEFLRWSVDQFTLDPWRDAKVAVAIWIEKDALAGTLQSVTLPLGVPLHVIRGSGGVSFIEKQAAKLNALGRPVFMYHLGDFDPSGQYASEKLKQRLEQFLKPKLTKRPGWFTTLALTPEQIRDMRDAAGNPLQTRETKVKDNNLDWFVRKFGTDKRIKTLDRDLERIDAEHGLTGTWRDNANSFKDARAKAVEAKLEYLLELSPDSVELDAIEPSQLRSLVRDAIMQHTTAKRIKASDAEELSIKVRLSDIADNVEMEDDA
jgi:hypothetical protein